MFSLVFIISNKTYVTREKYEVRPLCLSLNTKNNYLIISSNSDSFKYNSQYRLIEDIKGEILISINNDTLKIKELFKIDTNIKKRTTFEYIYFMNSNVISNNILVKSFRINLGKLLFQSLESDFNELYNKFNKNKNVIICGIPNSNIVSTQSVSNKLNIKYHQFININENSN
jgi:glutamine phosphoribosylpyrophosphate amidotransferase